MPRLTSEYPFNSPYSIEFKGALLHFPLVEGFNASSEASVLALETSLNVPFGESSGGVKVIFQHPY